MEITINDQPQALIVSATGNIDASTAPQLEKAIRDFVTKPEKPLVLNLDKLDYVSSAGLRVVLLSAKQLKAKGQELILSGLHGGVKDVFELSGFYSIFKIFESPEDALAAL